MSIVSHKNIEFRDLFTLDFDNYCKALNILKQLSNSINLESKYVIKERINKLNTYLSKNINHKIFAIYYNFNLVGVITMLIEPKIIHDFRSVCHVEDFAIDDAYRGLGIGRIVLEKIKNLAQTYNCYKIILNCNNLVTGFYEKCGYVKTNEQMAMYLHL